MPVVANGAVLIVALLHGAIGLVEMFFWKQPRVYGRLDRFGFSQAEADKVAPIVANAGLYNLFVAAAIAWGVFAHQPWASVFALSFAVIAGLYGAATLKWTTLVVQTIPAVIATLAVWNAWP